MKKYLFLILFPLFVFNSFAQNSFELNINDNTSYYYPHYCTVKDDIYYISYMQFNSFPNNVFSRILQIDESGNTIEGNNINLINTAIKYIYIDQSNNLNFIGSKYYESENSTTVIFSKYNSSFEAIFYKEYIIKPNSLLEVKDVINDSENNFIIAGYLYNATSIDSTFLLKVNNEGDSLTYKTFKPSNDDNKIERINNGYVLTTNDREFYKLDNNLNIVSYSGIYTIIHSGLWADFKVFSDKKYLYTGVNIQFNNSHQDYNIGIALIDSGLFKIKEKSFGKYDTNDATGYLKSIDFINKNNIFLVGTSNFYTGEDPFFRETPSWYIVNNIDSNLNLRWQKFYGGEVSYFLETLLATEDGGCLLLGRKYDYQTQGNSNTMHILKIDQNGLITSNKETQQIKSYNAIVYPNPAKDKLTFRIAENFTNSEITINDLSGKQIQTIANVSSIENIDISSFSNGIYVFTIKNNNQIIETGRFVKE